MMAASDAQLTIPLPVDPAYALDAFVEALCNREAVAWLKRWPDWPDRILLLVGPKGAGKTHLGRVWAAKAQARLYDGRTLGLDGDPQALFADSRAVLIEHVDGVVNETGLFHLLNTVRSERLWLLLTARTPPARWQFSLNDLNSRLRALPLARIDPPDDDLLAALLWKLFADRQLAIEGHLIDYLLPRMERSFEGALALVAALDAAALAQHRPLTVPLAREVLDALAQAPAGALE